MKSKWAELKKRKEKEKAFEEHKHATDSS